MELASQATGGKHYCRDPSCTSCGKDHRCCVVLAVGGVCNSSKHRHTAHTNRDGVPKRKQASQTSGAAAKRRRT